MRMFSFVFILMLSPNLVAQNLQKVIDLHYKNAKEVERLIQPLLQEGDRISGEGHTLVVNVSPKTLTSIRAVLHRIDVPPVTFEVSVYQGTPHWLDNQREATTVISTDSNQEQQRFQTIQVMSGESAYISTGKNHPFIRGVGLGLWNTGVAYERRNVNSGVYISPSLQGSKVKLTLRKVRDQLDNADKQVVDEQDYMTTMMMPMNRWVALGSAQGKAAEHSGARVYTAGNTYWQHSTLYIKVRVKGQRAIGGAK